MNDERVRVGVVGVGYFGRFHALKYARHPRAFLVALADADPARLVDVAAETGAAAFTDAAALEGHVEAVSIAAPAPLHAPLALAFLAAGTHVLVEKPLALSLGEADRLIAEAKRRDLVVQVGHQERAVLAAAGLFDIPERPRAVSCVRRGPFTGRNTDVDVVLDLMTHDLDMALALAPADIEAVEAMGRAERTGLTDVARVAITLAGGTRLAFDASRVHDRRERTMRIDYPSGSIAIDFLARSLVNTTAHRLHDIFPPTDDQAGVAGDPLGYALDRFLAAVRGEGPPLVSALDARRAMVAADLIRARLARDAAPTSS